MHTIEHHAITAAGPAADRRLMQRSANTACAPPDSGIIPDDSKYELWSAGFKTKPEEAKSRWWRFWDK